MNKYYAVGDIHGQLDKLKQMYAAIQKDSGMQSPNIIFLGDYVDRGFDSKGVLDFLCGLDKKACVFLKGNHDDMMLKSITHNKYSTWLSLGGWKTLKSYGVKKLNNLDKNKYCLDDEYDVKNFRLPEEHRIFLSNLLPYVANEDFFFSHGGVSGGYPLDNQPWNALVYGDDKFHMTGTKLKYDQKVVYGHYAVNDVIDKPNRICIDTGCGFSGDGRLTAMVIEGKKYKFIQV